MVEGLREAAFKHQVSMEKELGSLSKQLVVLLEVIDMKFDVALANGIMKSTKEPLSNWKHVVEFKLESLRKSEHGLKNVYDVVKKLMDKLFSQLKIFHTESQVIENHQLVDIQRMKSKFLE